MKRSRSSARALAITLKPFVARGGVALLLSVSMGLVVVSSMNRTHGAIQNMRAAITDAVTPIVNVLAKPADAVSAAGRWVSDMAALHEDNIRLKADNDRLRQWQSAATELSSENEKLRALLKFAPAAKSAYLSARVAADTDSPYSRSVIIMSGKNQGVANDQAVVSEAGLVGRIVNPARTTARVLLLTDMNSRIPVISENSRERAIAGGNNSDTLNLIYLPENSKLQVGEKIVTSGDGSVLPSGLPVGVVTKIEKGVATVTPFADSYHLELVSVIDYPAK